MADGLPNITGKFTSRDNGDIWAKGGAFTTTNADNSDGYEFQSKDSSKVLLMHSFDASRCSSIYGNSDNVQPKSLTIVYAIKY